MAQVFERNAAQRKPKSKKLTVVAVAATVFMALVGTGYWYASGRDVPFIKRPKQTEPKAAVGNSAPGAVIQLQSFVVNLADPDHSSFLRVGIALGLNKPQPTEGNPDKDSPYTPEIRDAILSILSTWTSGDLLAPDGRTRLKRQLLTILQQRVPKLGVTDVYFTDFLIQE